MSMSKKIKKPAVLFVLLCLFLIVSFGLSNSSSMKMKSDGAMSGCMFDGQAAVCLMTFSEHLSKWQSMFNTFLQKSSFSIRFAILVSVCIFSVTALRRYLLLLLLGYFSGLRKLYLKENPNLPLFDYRREALFRGILNTKIY